MAKEDDVSPVPASGDDTTIGHGPDPARFPTLAAALARPEGKDLRREILAWIGPQFQMRAARRPIRILCRLEGPGYDEPVLVKDISTSGVRFLVQADVTLDLNRMAKMFLHVRVDDGSRTLAIELVRRCGGDQRHTDIACRFVDMVADHAQIVAEISSQIFGDAPTEMHAV